MNAYWWKQWRHLVNAYEKQRQEDVDGSSRPTGKLSAKSVGWQPSGAESAFKKFTILV